MFPILVTASFVVVYKVGLKVKGHKVQGTEGVGLGDCTMLEVVTDQWLHLDFIVQKYSSQIFTAHMPGYTVYSVGLCLCHFFIFFRSNTLKCLYFSMFFLGNYEHNQTFSVLGRCPWP